MPDHTENCEGILLSVMVRRATLCLSGGRTESVGGRLLDGGDRETGEVRNCGREMERYAPFALASRI